VKKSTQKKKAPLTFYGGDFLVGSKLGLIVTDRTTKSITLSYGGVSLGKHFGKVTNEHQPS